MWKHRDRPLSIESRNGSSQIVECTSAEGDPQSIFVRFSAETDRACAAQVVEWPTSREYSWRGGNDHRKTLPRPRKLAGHVHLIWSNVKGGDLIVDDDGQELRAIVTGTGTVESRVYRKQFSRGPRD